MAEVGRKNLGYSGLSHVNNLQPTAELRPLERAQTDEKDLMPYSVLVAIEKLGIRDRKKIRLRFIKKWSLIILITAALKTHIKKFFRLWTANRVETRAVLHLPFHFDDLNVDPHSWCRFPILSGNFAEELAALNQLP